MSKKRSLSGPAIFFLVVGGGVLLLVLMLGGMWLLKNKGGVTVTIIQPSQPAIITSGRGVMLVAEGKAGKGVQRIEFYVNDVLQSQQVSQEREDTFQAAFPWFGSQAGVQKLSMVAYDAQGRASAPALLLIAVKAIQMPQPVSRVVEDQGVEEDADAQAGQESVEDQGQSERAEEIDDEQMEEILEQADEDGQFPQELPDQPQDEPPSIRIRPNLPVHNGDVTSFSGLVSASDDLGLDFIYFAIFASGNHLETRIEECFGAMTCSLDYDLSFDSGERIIVVKAFDISGQASGTKTQSFQIIGGGGDELDAIVIGDSFDASDLEVANDQIERQEESAEIDYLGTPSIVKYGCSGHTIVLEVPYVYRSNHGDQVYVGAWAQKDGTMVAAGQVLVERGSGVARFEMEAIAIDLVDITDQLELHFMTPEGDYFYIEMADLVITWPVPKPDLRITYASVTEGEWRVDVENMGCASVDGFNLRWHLQEGEELTEFIDAYIAPGVTHTWTKFVPMFNLNLFSRGYQVAVDPDNDIEEINEDNNAYDVRPITLKHVHIYKLVVHDTSEGDNTDPGEFYFDIIVGDKWAGVPEGTDVFWSVHRGPYNIDEHWQPIILIPTLNWNQDLRIIISGYENDNHYLSNDNDYLGEVSFTHSHDMLKEDNWKTGGDFSATSDHGYFTIYWRVVLDD